MLIIIDERLPKEVSQTLREIGEVFCIPKNNIVYDSIQGHPDIFILQMGPLAILAPNAPIELKEIFKKHRIPFLRGKEKLGNKYPETALYNALFTTRYLIHNKNITDSCITNQAHKTPFLHVKQGYTRCNLIELPDGSFITSDKGIENTLLQAKLQVHYFSSADVALDNQSNGFLPGAMGIYNNTLYIIGSLKYYSQEEKLKELLKAKNIKLVELYNGPLIDGGGILFL